MPPSFYQRVFSTTIRAAEDSLPPSILRVMYRLSGPLEMIARGMINGKGWYKKFENSDAGIKGYLIAEEVEGASLGSDDVDLVILYTHGGGFRLGHPLIPLALFIQWIQTFKANHNAKVQILSLEYPLSPENPFPAARDCVIQCYTWLVMSQGISPSRIAFAGDSAGGNLAAIAAIKISNSQIEGNSIFLPPPSSLILVSPCFNAFTTAESFQSNEMNDIISVKWFGECLHDYIASTGLPPDTPSISPIFEKDISKMPRFWVCIGEYEVMRDDAKTFVKKAQSQGVTAELVVENANQHNYAVSCLVSRNFAHLKAADQVGVFLFGKTASSS